MSGVAADPAGVFIGGLSLGDSRPFFPSLMVAFVRREL